MHALICGLLKHHSAKAGFFFLLVNFYFLFHILRYSTVLIWPFTPNIHSMIKKSPRDIWPWGKTVVYSKWNETCVLTKGLHKLASMRTGNKLKYRILCDTLSFNPTWREQYRQNYCWEQAVLRTPYPPHLIAIHTTLRLKNCQFYK